MTIVRLMSLVTLEGWTRYKETGKYSIKGSLVVALLGTILLWWLPIFGPMLSGYVAGRVSGTKYKGLLTTSIIAAIFGLSSYMLTYYVNTPEYIVSYLNGTIIYHIRVVDPFLSSFFYNLGVSFSSFTNFLVEVPQNWAVLIAFGFLGGSMSELLYKDKEKKSTLSPKHRNHNDENAMEPKVVEYEPGDKQHPLIKKAIKDKEKEEDSQDEYI